MKETFAKKLPDRIGMYTMESLADTIALLIPMNHFNRILIVTVLLLF